MYLFTPAYLCAYLLRPTYVPIYSGLPMYLFTQAYLCTYLLRPTYVPIYSGLPVYSGLPMNFPKRTYWFYPEMNNWLEVFKIFFDNWINHSGVTYGPIFLRFHHLIMFWRQIR